MKLLRSGLLYYQITRRRSDIIITVMKVYEFKLRPNKSQVVEIERMLDRTRTVYNEALEQLVMHHRDTGKYLHKFEQDRLYNKETVPDLPAMVVDCVIDRLHKSFKSFLTHKGVGHPRFQSKDRWHSFEYRDAKFGGRIVDGVWRMTKYLRVKVIQHREMEGIIKKTRLVKKADGYYVQAVCESEDLPKKVLVKGIGVDLGLKYFIADSSGKKIDAPQYFRKSLRKLARIQKSVSRKTVGSSNRWKARQVLGKHHLKVTNQRRDFLHKVSTEYAKSYDYVVMEDLVIKNMVRNHHLALSINDASWYEFKTMLAYKLRTLGGQLLLVNPAYTSQTCSNCGAVAKKSLSQRTHYCPQCLYIDCRDVNAAKNILRLGQPTVEQHNSVASKQAV